MAFHVFKLNNTSDEGGVNSFIELNCGVCHNGVGAMSILRRLEQVNSSCGVTSMITRGS